MAKALKTGNTKGRRAYETARTLMFIVAESAKWYKYFGKNLAISCKIKYTST